MGRSTQLIVDGRVVGYECQHGHKHSSAAEAMDCDPDSFAKLDTDAKKQAEEQRQEQILNNPNFKKAIAAAKSLGAANDDDAEAVVLKNGIDKVLAARDSQQKLSIPKSKVAAPPAPPTT